MMKLNNKQKKQIEEELAAFTNEYAGKTKEERKSKGKAGSRETNRKNESQLNLKAFVYIID